MLTVVLGLASAVAYGLSDFAGGVLSRRASVWPVAVVTQLTALVGVGATSLLLSGTPSTAEWLWGSFGGIGTGFGTAFLYRGLAAGRMGVVAPLSAVGAAVIPVVVGLATGERPALLAWVGIALAFPAIWLVSSSAGPSESTGRSRWLGPGVVDGLLAGLGFGLMFAALGQVSDTAGLKPLAAAELTSIPTVVGLATAMRHAWLPTQRDSWGGVVVGALAGVASVLFLLATQAGLLAIASVLTSLYPAVTVLLAATLLRERIHRPQAVGLVLAATAVVLVASA